MPPAGLILVLLMLGTFAPAGASDLSADQVARALAQASAEQPANFDGKDLSDLELSRLFRQFARLEPIARLGLEAEEALDAFVHQPAHRDDREALIKLWREEKIGDDVLSRFEREIDLAEARLVRDD